LTLSDRLWRSKLENFLDSRHTKTQKSLILASNQAREFCDISQSPKNLPWFSSISSKQMFGLYPQILSLVNLWYFGALCKGWWMAPHPRNNVGSVVEIGKS
jgi:hypothetical protein